MSYYELTITIADALKDRLIQNLMHSGCLGVYEQDEAIVAYFPESADIRIIINDLSVLKTLLEKSDLPYRVEFSWKLIPDQDWNESWKKSFQPIDVGDRFTILPPWGEIRGRRIHLIIEPAMAFGTGHHGTTRSCLVLMEKYSAESKKELFLDIGTGTGILAIAAHKLGYRRVIGVDTDPLAVDAARQNAVLNNVIGVEIQEGSIANLDEASDVIVANLITDALVRIAPLLASRLKPGGIAILSGMLSGQEDEVIAAIQQAGMTLVERYPDGKWISLVVSRLL